MTRKRLSSERSPRTPARLHSGVSTGLFALLVLCAAGVVAPVPGTAHNAYASSTGTSPCTTPAVRESLTTSQRRYGPGVVVVMTSLVRNISTKVCDVGVGPTSPSITVTNSRGAVVWDSCYAHDRPGACAQYLVSKALNPGATYARMVTWDQRSGRAGTQVPPGTYHVTARFSAVAGVHATRVQLTTAPSPQTITVTQADSGQSVSLHEGDHLVVQLSGPAIYTWTEPVSSNGAVLARSTGSSGKAATASFVATLTGLVRVTASGNPNCYPQCLAPSRLFVLTVSVIA